MTKLSIFILVFHMKKCKEDKTRCATFSQELYPVTTIDLELEANKKT